MRRYIDENQMKALAILVHAMEYCDRESCRYTERARATYNLYVDWHRAGFYFLRRHLTEEFLKEAVIGDIK